VSKEVALGGPVGWVRRSEIATATRPACVVFVLATGLWERIGIARVSLETRPRILGWAGRNARREDKKKDEF
jgi:hypothetical protein